jgi:phenylacetate-CoA ligase
MAAYNWCCRTVLLPLGDRLSGQSIMRHYRAYERLQWDDPDTVARMRDENLRRTIRSAYEETTFYRDLYDKHGVRPSMVETLADLSILPVVTKDMLRQSYPHGCTRPTPFPRREYFTSGSTGQPFTVMVDSQTMSIVRALMMFRATLSGWRPGDAMLQTGMTLERGLVKAAKDCVLRTRYVSGFDLSNEKLDRYLDLIKRHRIDFVMGYAASIFCLAQRAEATGVTRKLRGVVSWGDNMFPHYRRLIQHQFGCRVTDTYGCGEGLQIAAQCAAGQYHIFEPHVAVEICRDGVPVRAGELGEIVVTRLDPGAMPLIRYSVGDLGREGTRGVRCACGRTLPTLLAVEGRAADVVLTSSGNRLIVHLFTGIFEYARSVETFQVVQDRVGEILVRIVPKGQFDEAEWEQLKEEILEKGDRGLQIRLEVVDAIPVEGPQKRRFVVSRLWRNPDLSTQSGEPHLQDPDGRGESWP